MQASPFRRLTARALLPVALAGLAGCGDSTDDKGPGSGPEVEQARSTKARLPADASTDAVRTLTSNNVDCAFDLLRTEDPDGNFFYSPHSISIALAMTYAGAKGQTRDEMAAALHFAQPDAELHAAFNTLDQKLATRGQGAQGADGEPFRLTIANAAWAQRDYAFLPTYLDVLAESYGAGVNLLDFVADPEGGRKTINDWVDVKTEGRIPDLLPEGVVNSLTRLVLTNAVYFNASWDEPFEEEDTVDGAFTLLDGTSITVPLMSQDASHRYAEGSGYRAVEMDYDGDEVSMLVIVPDAGTFDAFEAELSSAKLDSIVGALEHKEVSLTFPKFEFRTKLSLSQVLTDMGMPTAFTGSADFSGMNGTGGLQIQDVIHEAFVKVNEAGTEAAAATAVVGGLTSAPEYVELDVTRPFFFVIRDEETGAALFIGRVVDPSA